MPGYRGRLIWPFSCTIARYDSAATLADTGGGAFDEGFDHVFREPQVVSGGGSDDTIVRVEQLVTLVPCQVCTEKGAFGQLTQMLGGNSPGYKLMLVFHYVDLEARGLIDTDGSALFKVNDRLVSIERRTGTVVRDFTSQPLYATQVQDRSFGLDGLERNLLEITFEERDTSSISGS